MRFFKGLGIGIVLALIAWFIMLFCFQLGRTYQAHEIRKEIKQNCHIGNICHVHSLDMTLPLFMANPK
jgi:hypothetical protein